MIHSRDIPFWSETLDMLCTNTPAYSTMFSIYTDTKVIESYTCTNTPCQRTLSANDTDSVLYLHKYTRPKDTAFKWHCSLLAQIHPAKGHCLQMTLTVSYICTNTPGQRTLPSNDTDSVWYLHKYTRPKDTAFKWQIVSFICTNTPGQRTLPANDTDSVLYLHKYTRPKDTACQWHW